MFYILYIFQGKRILHQKYNYLTIDFYQPSFTVFLMYIKLGQKDRNEVFGYYNLNKIDVITYKQIFYMMQEKGNDIIIYSIKFYHWGISIIWYSCLLLFWCLFINFCSPVRRAQSWRLFSEPISAFLPNQGALEL